VSVVSLAEARAERTPHWAGTAYCVGCQHEWVAAAPMGTMNLECPACALPKGRPKYPFSASAGDLLLVCDCGCEALYAYKREGKFYTKCMGCGGDLTEAFYG
jgi:hypothetical protein